MKKRIFCFVLASIMIIGVLASCAPTVEPQQDPPAAAARDAAAPAATPAQAPTATPAPPPPTGASGRLIMATANETPSIAPARHNAAAGSMKNFMTHSQLFRSHYETLEVVPYLIAEWTALSDVLFEFRLHEGILFHNGEEMTAYDVVASHHYVRNYPDTRAAHLSAVAAEVVDRYTFTIYTGTPNAALFFDLLHQGNSVFPQSLIDSGHDFTVNPVGSGPFVFENWSFGDSLSFRAFEGYFDNERAARIEEVVFRIIPEGASRTIALETGEVDYIIEVPYADVPRMMEHPNITVYKRPGTAFHHLVLNNSIPQFENLYARRAINMAIDQEALVAVAFEGLAIPLRAQVPTVFAGTTSEGATEFDPEGARALLAEHGIDPESLGFEMIASTEERRRMGEVVQAQLADIGIPTTIVMMDHATTLAAMNDGNYETGFGMWSASFLISTLRGVLYGGIGNRSRTYNDEIDALLRQGMATIDSEARNAIFEELSRVANEYSPNVPTHLNMHMRAFNSNLVIPEISPVFLNVNMFYWAE